MLCITCINLNFVSLYWTFFIDLDNLIQLLEYFTKSSFENGTSIYSARINTLGDRVEDTFEIEDVTLSCVADKKIKKISESLKEII